MDSVHEFRSRPQRSAPLFFIQSSLPAKIRARRCINRRAADEPDSWMIRGAPVRPLRTLLPGPRHRRPSFRLVKPNKSERRRLRPIRKPATGEMHGDAELFPERRTFFCCAQASGLGDDSAQGIPDLLRGSAWIGGSIDRPANHEPIRAGLQRFLCA